VSRKVLAALIAGFAVVDVLFLRWVFIHFGNWGFWDWDYQQTLLEVARVSVVEYGQLPLWNPYLGGGVSLAGHTLNHTWSPSFAIILLFGTLAGTKLCIAIYLALAQWGAFRLARSLGQDVMSAAFAATVFSLGGVYAQRLSHGQFEWIAIAWVPFVIHALDRAREARVAGASRFASIRPVVMAGGFFALLILDGGPYQFAFFGVFLGLYACIRSFEVRAAFPVLQLAMSVAIAVGIAAVKLFPVLDLVTRYPRITSEDPFYGAPFEPGLFAVLFQMFLSRAQSHDPAMWMPYVLNVGCYVGIVPLVLAGLALGWNAARYRAWIATGAITLWISLGVAAPIDLWHLLHRLPGFDMLRVPARFNVYALLAIALLAGAGLTALRERIPDARHGVLAGATLLLVAAVNLVIVNGDVFKVAFSIRPLETAPRAAGFETHYAYSPFIARYRQAALYEVHPNWPSGSFPAVLENRGVRWAFKTIPFPSHALSTEDAGYRGEAWVASGEGRIEAVEITPNRISLRSDGGPMLLRVNTNFDPGWRVRSTPPLELVELDGTLALNVPSGMRELELVYRPVPFYWGAGVSLSSLVAATAVLRRRTLKPSNMEAGESA
jgi:hypothetical protein